MSTLLFASNDLVFEILTLHKLNEKFGGLDFLPFLEFGSLKPANPDIENDLSFSRSLVLSYKNLESKLETSYFSEIDNIILPDSRLQTYVIDLLISLNLRFNFFVYKVKDNKFYLKRLTRASQFILI